MRKINILTAFWMGVSVIFAGGCSTFEPVSDPTRSFVLEVLGVPESEQDGREAVSIAIDRVEIPTYLENPGLATRRGDSEIDYSSLFYWAEPLPDGIARTVAGNLQQNPAVDHVTHIPWSAGDSESFQVRLKILQFDYGDNQVADLKVIAEIRSPQDRGQEWEKNFWSYRQEAGEDTVEERVHAQSLLLNKLSRGLLDSILSMRR